MNKHTPGPWTWGKNENGLYGSGQENEVLTYAGYEGMWLSHTEHRIGNAYLIAAAPELLEALRNLLVRCSAEMADPIDVHEIYAARLAVAKATGVSP